MRTPEGGGKVPVAVTCALSIVVCSALGRPLVGVAIAAAVAMCRFCDDPYIGPWTDIERKNRR